jgi:hypothetical protein
VDEPEYENTAGYEWTKKAYDCGHDIDTRETLSAAVTGYRGQKLAFRMRPARAATVPIKEVAVDVGCGCGRTHRGAPNDKITGCGVSFRVIARLPAS